MFISASDLSIPHGDGAGVGNADEQRGESKKVVGGRHSYYGWRQPAVLQDETVLIHFVYSSIHSPLLPPLRSPSPFPSILFWTTQVSKCSPTISISLLLTLRLTLTLTPLLLLLLFDFVWNINIDKASAKSKHSHRNMAWEAKGEGQLLLLAPLTTTLVRQHGAPRDPPPQYSNALQQIRLYIIFIGKKLYLLSIIYNNYYP